MSYAIPFSNIKGELIKKPQQKTTYRYFDESDKQRSNKKEPVFILLFYSTAKKSFFKKGSQNIVNPRKLKTYYLQSFSIKRKIDTQ